jgi:hypothetical protein
MSALLAPLERRMFVSPALRKLVGSLPDRADPRNQQVTAVMGLVIANAWMCLGDVALDLFGELDRVTALGFTPTSRRVEVGRDDPASSAAVRSEVEGLTARLGFPPGRRAKVTEALESCARAVASYTRGSFELHPVLAPRGLRVGARIEGHLDDRRFLGSAPAWSPRRLERVADEFALRQDPLGRIHLHAIFHAVAEQCDARPRG